MFYRTIKAAWRTVAPEAFHTVIFGGQNPFSRALLSIKGRMESGASHDDIYDRAYYQRYAAEMEDSAIGMVDAIVQLLKPASIIDVGCGSGEVVARFKALGIAARGMDYSQASVAICREKGLNVVRFDIEGDAPAPDWLADVVVSTEVAEHIPEEYAERYVRSLLKMAKRSIVITAAPPGQGGTDHVNEQPKSYWIDLFARNGSRHDAAASDQMRAAWHAAGVERTRTANVIVFTKSSS